MAAEVMTEASVDAEALEAFAAGLRGPVLRPGGRRLRRRARDLERADRPPAGADRAVHGRRRRRRRGQLRPRAEPAALGQGRRPQRRRQRGQRRRPRDRPVADARRPRRPVDADGARAGRRDLGRLRPRDAALRARGAGRRRLDDRHRRPDAARRRRPPAPQVRPLDRQPALGRHRHRRRAAPPRERDRERGSLLGGARRRQQLRRRHVVRVPGASGRPDGDGRRRLLSAGATGRRSCRPGATTWPPRRTS